MKPARSPQKNSETSVSQFVAPQFIALIPARLASTRLPNKPLAMVGGLPMVVRVAQQARASGADRVAVATDAQEIANAVRAHGFEVVMTREDHTSGTERLAEAAQLLGLPDEACVVNVQGDEPLIEPKLISAVAQTLQHHLQHHPATLMATAAHPITSRDDYDSPHVVKVVLDASGHALYFSRSTIPHDRSRSLPTTNALRHVGLYAYTAGFLKAYAAMPPCPLESIEALEQLRVLWHGHRIAVHVTDAAPAPGVDTAEDLARVNALLLGP